MKMILESWRRYLHEDSWDDVGFDDVDDLSYEELQGLVFDGWGGSEEYPIMLLFQEARERGDFETVAKLQDLVREWDEPPGELVAEADPLILAVRGIKDKTDLEDVLRNVLNPLMGIPGVELKFRYSGLLGMGGYSDEINFDVLLEIFDDFEEDFKELERDRQIRHFWENWLHDYDDILGSDSIGYFALERQIKQEFSRRGVKTIDDDYYGVRLAVSDYHPVEEEIGWFKFGYDVEFESGPPSYDATELYEHLRSLQAFVSVFIRNHQKWRQEIRGVITRIIQEKNK